MNNVYNLYDKLSIENWILPACYLGVIDVIVWIKPPWSNQIKDGRYDFKIGKQKGTDKVLISCLQNYFIAEGKSKIIQNRAKIQTGFYIMCWCSTALKIQSREVKVNRDRQLEK